MIPFAEIQLWDDYGHKKWITYDDVDDIIWGHKWSDDDDHDCERSGNVEIHKLGPRDHYYCIIMVKRYGMPQLELQL